MLLESSANSALSTSPSPFYMLPYHRDRMLEAAAHFGWSVAAERIRWTARPPKYSGKLEAAMDIKSSTPLRVRTVLHYDGDITVETNKTLAVPLANLFPSCIPPPAPKLEVSPLTGAAMMLAEGDYSSVRGTTWQSCTDTALDRYG